jgi:hypothetical protein
VRGSGEYEEVGEVESLGEAEGSADDVPHAAKVSAKLRATSIFMYSPLNVVCGYPATYQYLFFNVLIENCQNPSIG